MHESVFDLLVAYTFAVELYCKPIMRVAIELQPEGCPSRDTQIAEAVVFIDKIKIVVETTTGIVLKICSVCLLVVPWFESHACFHCGKNVYESGGIATFGDYFLNTFVLAEVLLADELNINAIFLGDSLCVFINEIAQRRCPHLKIKNPDAMSKKKVSYSTRITDVRQGSLDD